MTLQFEPTTDPALITRILTEPKCWRRAVNDSAPTPENFKPLLSPLVHYIVARNHRGVCGLFVIVPSVDYFGAREVHFSILPEYWGFYKGSFWIARHFLEWVWRETTYDVLIGPVPSYNRLALKLAKDIGFEEWKVVPSEFTRRGRPFDLILTRITKPIRQQVDAAPDNSGHLEVLQ